MNNALVADNIGLVRAIAKRRFPALRFDEDLLQSGMVGLCSAAASWQGRGKFANYATVCIQNEMYSYLRTIKHWQRIHSGVLYDSAADKRGVMPVSDYIAARIDVAAQIERHWPPDSRQRYILLALAEGKRKKDIGAALALSSSAVTRIARRAMAKMEQPLDP